MKRIIVVLVLCFGLLLPALSQDKAFQFGFKVAPNLGWIKPQVFDYERVGVNAGFGWGFVTEVFLMENYTFNSGFDVVYLNGTYSYPHWINGQTGIQERKLRTKYIEIPLMLKMKTNEMGSVRFYGAVGFGLSFLLDATSEDVFFVNDQGGDVERFNVKNEIRGTRESLLLGAGVEYDLGGSTFIAAGLKFDNNFIDILKGQNLADQSVENKAISNFIAFQLSLLF